MSKDELSYDLMEMIWIITGFFIFITILFVVLAYAFPEWFGITGKKALEVQKEHLADSPPAENNSKSEA